MGQCTFQLATTASSSSWQVYAAHHYDSLFVDALHWFDSDIQTTTLICYICRTCLENWAHFEWWCLLLKSSYCHFCIATCIISTIINKLLIPNTLKVNFLIPGLVSGQGGGKATPPIIRLTPRQWDLPIDSKVQQYYLRFWLFLSETGKKLHNVCLFVCVRYFPSYPRGWHY